MQNNIFYTKSRSYRYFFFSGLILLSFFSLNVKLANATAQIFDLCYTDGCVKLLDNPGGYWINEAAGYGNGQQLMENILRAAASETAGLTTTQLNWVGNNISYVACANGVNISFTAHGCGSDTLNDTCPSGCGADTLNDTCPPPTPSGCGAGTLNDTCPTCSSKEGKICYSSRNSCSMRSSGTYDCDGYCDAETPDDSECAPPCVPDGSCNASAPSCEATTYGSDNCGGSCSKTGGSCCVSNNGSSCSSGINSCGVSNNGTIQCDGSCNATKPEDPTVTATISATPNRVKAPGATQVSWTTTGATSCTIKKNDGTTLETLSNSSCNLTPTSVSDIYVTTQSIYTITCINSNSVNKQTAQTSYTVNVVPGYVEF